MVEEPIADEPTSEEPDVNPENTQPIPETPVTPKPTPVSPGEAWKDPKYWGGSVPDSEDSASEEPTAQPENTVCDMQGKCMEMKDGKLVETKSFGKAKKNTKQTIRDSNGNAVISMKGVGSFSVGNKLSR